MFAETPPAGEVDGDGPVLIGPPLPVAALRRSQSGGAEVWPGRADSLRPIAIERA